MKKQKAVLHFFGFVRKTTSDYTRSPVGEVPRLSARMSFCYFSKRRETFFPF